MDKRSYEIASRGFVEGDLRWKNCLVCGNQFFSVHTKVRTCGYQFGNELKKRIAAEKASAAIPEGVIDRRAASKKWDTPIIKECTVCGQRYAVPKSLEVKYSTCSKECTAKRHSKVHRKFDDVTNICKWCNNPFTPERGKMSEKRLFCSDECRLNDLNEKNRERRPSPIGSCIICGASFRKNRKSQKWCSRDCMWKDTDYVNRRSKSLAELAANNSPTSLEKWLYKALQECQFAIQTKYHLVPYIIDGDKWLVF